VKSSVLQVEAGPKESSSKQDDIQSEARKRDNLDLLDVATTHNEPYHVVFIAVNAPSAGRFIRIEIHPITPERSSSYTIQGTVSGIHLIP
jgi:hypothetical protein